MTAPTFHSSVEAPPPAARPGRIDLWSFALDRDDVDRDALSADERGAILGQLAAGEISSEEALSLLQGD